MEYEDLELSLRSEAQSISRGNRDWTSAEVSHKLEEIADRLADIKHRRQTGIDASMGKRSGGKLEI
ncbi:MAG: hypothetical protein ACYC6Z_05850 [Thermoleophilia bacterium]